MNSFQSTSLILHAGRQSDHPAVEYSSCRLRGLGRIAIALMAGWAASFAHAAVPAGTPGVFNPNANGSVYELIVEPEANGRILACGRFSTIGGQARDSFARMSVDGVVDAMNARCASDVSEQAYAFARDALGRIVGANGNNLSGVSRYNADGSVDPSFVSTCTSGCSEVHALATQDDGKVLIGGNLMRMNDRASYIFRLNEDGSLDSSFNADSIGSGIIYAIRVQPDGRILVGGANLMVRLQSDGQIDATEPLVGLIAGIGRTILGFGLQADGAILVASGQSLAFVGDGIERRSLARLNANGTLDEAFNPQVVGGFYGVAGAPAVQADGKILIGGSFTSVGGTARSNFARLNADGTLDTSFTIQASSWVRAIGIQADGRIVIGGDFTTVNGYARNRLARLAADGTLETGVAYTVTSYAGAGGTVSPLGSHTVVEAPGGATTSLTVTPDPGYRVLNATGCGGSLNGDTYTTGAITADCSVIITFLSESQQLTPIYSPFSPGSNGAVEELLLQADGTILAGGAFSAIGGQSRARIARLDPVAGTSEASYAEYSAASTVHSTAVQADGKVLYGGAGSAPIRVDADGVLDTGFAPVMLPANLRVRAMAAQADGTIYIGGSFTTIDGTARSNIARLTSTGALDPTFNPGTGTNSGTAGSVYAIASEPTGKIVVGGRFTTYNGQARVGLARLNPDGTLDTDFPAAATSIYAIHRQSDGSYLVGSSGGLINLGDGAPVDSTFIRITPTGTRDTSFGAIIASGAAIWAIAEQADGRILVGGSGLQPADSPSRSLYRFLADGTLDADFVTNIDGLVYTVVQEADGSILIGGSFTNVDGQSRQGIARLDANGRLITEGGFLISPVAGLNGSIWPATPQEVPLLQRLSFTVLPDAGYIIGSVTGCGGTLDGLTYTTGAMTADCQILATFIYAPVTVIVTPVAGANGSLSPSVPQTLPYAQTTSFTVIPDPGYAIGSVTGCGGILSGNVYTTGYLIAECNVEASFVLEPNVDVAIALETGGDLYVGQVAGFTLKVRNNSTTPVSAAALVSWAPPPGLLDIQWTCSSTPDSQCPTAGVDRLHESIVLAPFGESTFQVTARIAEGAAPEIALDVGVEVQGGQIDSDPVNNHAQSTLTIDGLFHGGFDE